VAQRGLRHTPATLRSTTEAAPEAALTKSMRIIENLVDPGCPFGADDLSDLQAGRDGGASFWSFILAPVSLTKRLAF
jgi:hypothetical protein